jgi:hypothetical protein
MRLIKLYNQERSPIGLRLLLVGAFEEACKTLPARRAFIKKDFLFSFMKTSIAILDEDKFDEMEREEQSLC